MSLLQRLETYHQLHPTGLSLYQKAGRRVLPRVVEQLFSSLMTFHVNHFLDATGGRFAVHALQNERAKEVVMVEGSRTALRCLQKSTETLPNIKLLAGALWDAPNFQAEVVFLLPQTDKGNLKVEADLMGACNALACDGVAYFVMHKDQGAKRYEKVAETLFGELELLDKDDGWRLCKAVKKYIKSRGSSFLS
jgi:16S rRNA (guanine1207-N2)-methyltransferase